MFLKIPHVKIVSSQLQYLDSSIRLVIVPITKALYKMNIKTFTWDPVLSICLKGINFSLVYQKILSAQDSLHMNTSSELLLFR